jgi:recombination protein RecR
MQLPDPMRRVIAQLAELPSIGPRQATRLAFHLVGTGGNTLEELSRDLADLAKVKRCERCFFVHANTGALCDICANEQRRHDVIMVVEKETDMLSLENTGKFPGRYLVLGGIPRSGVLTETQKLRIQALRRFIETQLNGKAAEIVLALNPSTAGDFYATIISKELGPLTAKLSRLGRGLPTGGEIEFADDETLGSALERRG